VRVVLRRFSSSGIRDRFGIFSRRPFLASARSRERSRDCFEVNVATLLLDVAKRRLKARSLDGGWFDSRIEDGCRNKAIQAAISRWKRPVESLRAAIMRRFALPRNHGPFARGDSGQVQLEMETCV